jgi:hypothetical protein
MKAILLNFILCMFLMLYPAKAMMDGSEEEPKILQVSTSQQSSLQGEHFSLVASINFPDDCLLIFFGFLDVNTLGRVAQVSTDWERVAETPDLWSYTGSQYYGDYLNSEALNKENPKQKVIHHYLSVLVNASESLEDIERLVSHYQLNLYAPLFKKYLEPNFLADLVTDLASREELIAQGNEEASERKFKSLSIGRYGYEEPSLAVREFNELLIKRGNQKAIERKIEALTRGDTIIITYEGPTGRTRFPTYGYEIDTEVARRLNELLVERGDANAIERKFRALNEGGKVIKNFGGYSWLGGAFPDTTVPDYGYRMDLSIAREFNELLIGKDYAQAIERKIEGLCDGKYGYEKDLAAARDFIEKLVKKGNSTAIKRKICGLLEGKYGYNKSPEDARDFNDFLVEKDDSEAFERKFSGLYSGGYGYEKNLTAAREFNELLVERGDQKAISTKIIGLAEGDHSYDKDLEAAKIVIESLGIQNANTWKYHGLLQGKYGYEKDLIAAREFNELLVERDDPEAIVRKIKGLTGEQYGYKKDSSVVREFIESLLVRDFPIARAIAKYIKAFAMKYGIAELGYEKDRESAIQFIKENYVPY